MKKHIPLLFATAGVFMLMLGGCKSQDGLTLKNGSVSWEEVKGAIEYQVRIDDSTDTCEENVWDLSKTLRYEGKHTVSVVAVMESGKEKEVGNLEVQAEQLAKPALAVVDSEDATKNFVWATDENVKEYVYDLYDGSGKQKIQAQKEELCKVNFDGMNKTLITVEAYGGSKGNTVFLDSETTYEFEGTKIFNFANLANYPFYFTSRGTGGLENFTVGTTLKKGNYKLDFVLYLMDSNGNTLTGNGLWGRRITDTMKDTWFCSTDVEGWPESGGTIPEATTAVTCNLEVNVNKYGEAVLNMGDFKANEMVVVADVRLDNKSVMASEAVTYEKEEVTAFDTSKLEQFKAVFRSPGDWMTEKNREQYELSVPTTLKDGVYRIALQFQLMDANGGMLSGNGLWGRRITDENMSEMIWCTEYDLQGFKGMDDMPKPTEVLTSEFTVTVKDGRFKLLCLDFNAGEIVAIAGVKKLSGSSERFNTSKLASYNNVFVSAGVENTEHGVEQFRIETTMYERKQVELEVTYYAMSAEGYMLAGNGSWGRRMMDEGSDEIWLCASAPSSEHSDAVNTIPEPTKAVTRKMLVTLNNKGRFFLDMYDFQKGETIVITDIKYNGVSIIK